MRVMVSIFGFVVFSFVAMFGIEFLEKGLLSGAELTALLIAFAVIGLILYFSTEIQEFSVGGNIVKLRQVKERAEQSILDLKAAQIENARFLISLAKRFPGGLGSGSEINDSRVDDFWMLYDQIEKIEGYEVLANDLVETLELIMKGQLLGISRFSGNRSKYRSITSLPEPDDVLIEALELTSIQQAVELNIENDDSSKIKAKLKVGISTYRKLYELSKKLKKKI